MQDETVWLAQRQMADLIETTVPGKGSRFVPTFSNTSWDGGSSEGEPPTH